jgi:hypothetical protein
MAFLVDELLGKRWSRQEGEFTGTEDATEVQIENEAACACVTGIPIQKVSIEGQEVTLIGLPLIFQQFQEDSKSPSDATKKELLETVKIYNPVPAGAEDTYATVILHEYAIFCNGEEPVT